MPGVEEQMKIVDAYMKFNLYGPWRDAVSNALQECNADENNNDLFLAVCEEMESDKTDYQISSREDCPRQLKRAAERAVKIIIG